MSKANFLSYLKAASENSKLRSALATTLLWSGFSASIVFACIGVFRFLVKAYEALPHLLYLIPPLWELVSWGGYSIVAFVVLVISAALIEPKAV